ncbi:hypothetical protein NUBL7079_19350 [Klebsiella pneumoniae]|nr:hypothetical protein BME14_26890 [Klebsiella pneumoniae]OVV29053.1 hypothetical protein BME86_18680 [Klebsiella pneumoniae]OVY15746.1 hypothetical protein BME79_15490 [Klebsiella pneumoniae]OVY26133.1 hypothetical protein BME78_15630 [Klebsiella pneumoniae]OVY28852.1 hypothetical protein BME77_15745 [Klebsiella pneumoniae]
MFCIFMVKKHSVLLLNNAIFTIEFNGLAQFSLKNRLKPLFFSRLSKDNILYFGEDKQKKVHPAA